MSLERAELLVSRWRDRIGATEAGEPRTPCPLDAITARELLESMLLTRHLDVAAHRLRASGHGHYTIASSGHEANAVLGRITRPGDPALLHYRSGAFVLERARQVRGYDAVAAILLSLVASSDDPVSGGRHKVFGGKPLGVIPQTSTIASHLPRALGIAFGLERSRKLGIESGWPSDAIVVASFGDASVNHSTALGAFNAASFTAHQRLPLPLLFVCEDNGLGISVRSPPGWIESRLRALPHVAYVPVDGTDATAVAEGAREAVDHCRSRRTPVVLHVRCVRLLGHAGSDADAAYRSPREIEEALERDPVLASALRWVRSGLLTAAEALAIDRKAEERVRAEAPRAVSRPKQKSRRAVRAPLEYPDEDELEPMAFEPLGEATRRGTERLTLAQGVNRALAEALRTYAEVVVFGEDVARKGGVYGVTKGLYDRRNRVRVFDTLLDEQTILGLSLGMAQTGLLPVPEIQYLAYLHNAEDQLRGEASTLRFFSNGAFDNPAVVRIAGLGYQRGFGGHFHNDNSVAVLRDVPGMIVAVPARADDALSLYRTAFALARKARRVVVFVEPIALYHEKDLYTDADGEWLAPAHDQSARFGRARIYGVGHNDLTIATYGNGVHLSLRAARTLARDHGLRARVLDLRWLAPLPLDDVFTYAQASGRLLFVDECRRSGSVSEQVSAAVLDRGARFSFARVTSDDCLIPLGDAARLVLLSEGEICEAALRLCSRGFLRGFSGTGRARNGERFAAVVGRVSMDLTAICVDDAPGLKEGDWIELDYDLPSAAAQSGLSQYELLTTLGPRLQRRWNS